MMNETDVEIQSLSIQSTPVEEICQLGRCLSVPKGWKSFASLRTATS